MNQKKKKNQIKLIEEQPDTKCLIYDTNKYMYNFDQFKMIRSFVDSIFKGKITLGEADKKQRILLENILEFSNRVRLRSKIDKKKARDTYKNINFLY